MRALLLALAACSAPQVDLDRTCDEQPFPGGIGTSCVAWNADTIYARGSLTLDATRIYTVHLGVTLDRLELLASGTGTFDYDATLTPGTIEPELAVFLVDHGPPIPGHEAEQRSGVTVGEDCSGGPTQSFCPFVSVVHHAPGF